MLHLDALLFYVFAFAVFHTSLQWLHRTYPAVLGYATDIRLEELLSKTNAQREEKGLPRLEFNEMLSQAAAAKARDMFAKNYWAHFAPDGKSPWEFVTSSGYRYAIAGENLAKNFSTSSSVVDAWMASPTHRDNVLKPQYRDIGFAIVNGVLNGEETTLVVQIFGATGGQLVQVPSKPAAKPVELPSAPSEEVKVPVSALGSVIVRPVIDAATLARSVIFLFVGFLLGVLAIDIWLVRQRKLVRLTGHTVGHLVFLGSLLFAVSLLSRGSIL